MVTYNENTEQLSLPTIPLKGFVAFPSDSTNFDLYSTFSKAAVEFANKTNSFVILVNQKNPFDEKKVISNIYSVGVVAKISQVIKGHDGSLKVLFNCIERAVINNTVAMSGYYLSDVTMKSITVEGYSQTKIEALRRVIISKVTDLINMFPNPSTDFILRIQNLSSLGELADHVASIVLAKSYDKQTILNEFNPIKRSEKLIEILNTEIDILQAESSIQKKTRKKMEENQREYFLREELKIIQSELGNDSQTDSDELYDEIVARKFPKNVEEKLLKELYKFNKSPFGSPEAVVLRQYIETCLDIPFGKYSKDSTDVSMARKILDRDHYGLKKVKERILEFIAVKQLNPNIKNQIICLIGPPGVGKTSLCSSIAKALKRKYVRVSLGGVRDEAEIRGHRKTYVGAMPGRIITALSECQTLNPVMVFDEIDKMASDVRGDPASAMLEVLDGEQNKAFRDHFVEMDVDLSSCMFIATANSYDGIPIPLIDRMEIIEIPSYTKVEKLNIAKNHLIPKQIKAHGLTKKTFKLSDDAIMSLIESYTAEAGVRNLEREIASLCRKAAKEIVENNAVSISITKDNISNFLGAEKFESEKTDDEDQIGVVNGMAYTSIGGDLLKIEAAIMKGTGKVQLTGKLGDVMKESAEIAISYIRENAEELGINPDFYSIYDIHIHAPEGAVPKDGPSAGVTMTTALVSVLSGKPVRRDIAMTGEITLRGKVLPIGGLREKTIAAYTGGVKNIIIPYKNLKDLEEVDDVVKENVKFIPCKTISDVLSVAFLKSDKKDKK